MFRRLLWSLLVLALAGCQPYIDHEQADFASEVRSFGPKRQLELIALQGDQRSLLLVFNQPLRQLEDSELNAPFQIEIQPAVEVASTTLEGMASVRVTFAKPLAASSSYAIEVPSGWRSMTGVALVAPISRRWDTPRPQIESANVVGGQPPAPGSPLRLAHGQWLELSVNQPVVLGSLRNALSLESLDDPSRKIACELRAGRDNEGNPNLRHFLLRPDVLRENSTYRLTLAAGVKGLEGPLRSDRPQELLIDSYRPLRYLGPPKVPGRSPVVLEFSDEVSPQEIARCLHSVPAGLTTAAVKVDPKNPQRLHLEFGSELPRRLILTGLTSVDGARLEEPVSIELTASADSDVQAGGTRTEPLVPIPLTGRILAGLGTGHDLATWRLSLDQAIAASVAPETLWSGTARAFWERARPIFAARRLPLIDGDSPVLGPGPAKPGFLAVRCREKSSRITRGLAVVSDLDMITASTPGGLRVKVCRRASGAPVSGCALILRGVKAAKIGESVRTDASGEALLDWGPEDKRPWPMFVVATAGKDQTFLPVGPIPPEAPGSLPSAFLTTDQPYYGPGREIVLTGFTWRKPALANTATVAIVPLSGGRAAGQMSVTIDESGLLQGRCAAPGQPGQYRLVLDERSSTAFRVCPVAQEGESYDLALVRAADKWKGTLTRKGARHRSVGLRAYLVSLPGQGDEVDGWSPLMGHRPAWETLAYAASDDEIHFSSPDPGAGGLIQLEAFDLDQPSLVVARTQQEIPAAHPCLQLQFEPAVQGPGQQIVVPVVSGNSDIQAEISAALMLRASDGDWQQIEVRPVLDEPWTLRFREPGLYRLLVRATLSGGQVLESTWERQIQVRDLADPDLTVEPKVAMPGATLTPALDPQEAGREVWLQLSSGGQPESGRFAAVAADGTLPPLTVEVARTLALEVRTQQLVSPRWGEQRALWQTHSTPVPLGPLSRKAELNLAVSRDDGVDAKPQAGQDLRLTLQRMGPGDGWTGVVMVSSTLQGWPSPPPALLHSFLGQPAPSNAPRGTYPLLDEGFAGCPSEIRIPVALEPESQLSLSGPAASGSYRCWAIGRDDAGRFAWAQVATELDPVSSWKPFLPWGARVGDSFEAGLTFQSGPAETGAIGLTGTALVNEGRLAPSGYLRTAGVAKPGSSYSLRFNYGLSQTASDSRRLGWELGHGGKRHQQDARLEVFDTPPVPRGGQLAILQTGVEGRLAVKGSQPWRLHLHAPQTMGEGGGAEEATVSVFGPTGSLGKVHLRPGTPHLEMQGAGPGTVTIAHEGGPPITYNLFRLQPDTGETAPWGARLYLMRQMVNEAGAAVSRLTIGKPSRVVIDLVNPAPLESVRVRMPLPGGVRPLALRKAREGTPAPKWSSGPGFVDFDLSSLPAGEFVWELEVSPEVAGDYLWPTAQATASGGLQALSGSSRVKVER